MFASLKKNKSLQYFLIFALIQTLLTVFAGIHEDEPYYWDWTRFLSFGYFDHPPMVAWMIRAMQPVFGMGPLAFKMAAAICSVGTVGALALLIRRFTTKPSALPVLFAIYLGTPLFGILSAFMTPDIPLFLFWALSLFIGYRLIEEKETPVLQWLLLGVTTGLGMYSKYTFVLFFPIFGLSLLLSRRDLLTNYKPYLSLLSAVVIGIPHLIWNHLTGWPSISFQMDHGLGATGYSLKYLGEYISSQMGLFNPLLFIPLIIAIVVIIKKYRQNPALVFLTVSTLFPLLFFAYSNLKKRGNANWPAMAFLSGAVLIVWLYDQHGGEKMKKYLRGSLIFGLVCMGIISLQMITPVLPVQSVVHELHGWKDLGESVDSLIDASGKDDLPMTANSYQMAGTMGLMLEGHPRVYAINLGSRTNHYAFLPERKEHVSGEFLFLQEVNEEGELPEFMKNLFSSITTHGTTTLTQGTKIRHYGLFSVRLNNPEELN